MNKISRFSIALICFFIVEFSIISVFETNYTVKASKPKLNTAEKNLDLLLTGNLDEVINDFNKYDSLKINDEENLEAFTTALIAYGDIQRVYPLLEYATKKFPKNNKFKNDLKSLLIFDQDFEAAKAYGLTNIEKAHIELKKAFYGENKLDLNDHEIREFIYNELLSKIDNRSPYFPSRLEYLYFLKTETARQEARKISLNIIEKFSEIAFPQTLDFYELAEAYRIMGLLAYDSKTDSQAYFEMARLNQNRMRSLWLIEDIRIYRPIMKILTRSTRFGYVFPQWIVSLNQFQ